MKKSARFTLFGAILMLLAFGVAQAQVLNVTTTGDGNVGCTGSGPYTCSTLRDAVGYANGLTTPVIHFTIPTNAPGCSAGICTISLLSVLPEWDESSTLTIDASTSTQSIVISGANQASQESPSPGFIQNYGPVTLNTLTITNFSCNPVYEPYCSFSAIWTDSPLTVLNSTFSSNSNLTGSGAAIYMQGNEGGPTLTITNSTFSGNSTVQGGGGAIYTAATTTITNSTFYNNSTVGSYAGGAIEANGARLNVINSTFSSNTYNNGAGSAIYATNGAFVYLFNTILAAETPPNNANCLAANSGQFYDYGGNLDDDTPVNTCNIYTGSESASAIVPDTGTGGLNLGSLGNYGGPTQTINLLANSIAINWGTVFSESFNCPATDQRGVARPISAQAPTCSSGAYQFAPLVASNGTGTAQGCTSPMICNITGGEDQSIAAGTPAAAAALAALTGNAAKITENICTVNVDPRQICPPGVPSSRYYYSRTLPVAAMCPSLPLGGAGNSVIPDYLCGAYGSGGAGTGTGFAVIQTSADGVNGIPGLLMMNDANPDAFFPPGGNPATECAPDGQFIDNISDGWGPWSLSSVEGRIPEGTRIVDLTDGCGGSKQTSSGGSIQLVGVSLTLPNATEELGGFPKTLVNFAEYKYFNLGVELLTDNIDAANKARLLQIVAQSALFLAAGKHGCAEDTLYEADRYVIHNASHFHGAPLLDPNSYGRTRMRILNLFFTLWTRLDGNVNPITDLGPDVNLPLLAPSLSGPPATCSVPYLGGDGY